uniref:PDZ domain-containing protein n=1 Tax=Guillardia theta TaxID=55529 RepID=A0A7S4K5Q7_GUITH
MGRPITPTLTNTSPSTTKNSQSAKYGSGNNEELMDSNKAGVGIFFAPKEGNKNIVFVKSIVKGTSADREGTVQVGDIIQEVDGVEVKGSAMSELRSLILGEIGTFVTLQFLRESADGELFEYKVSLIRGNASFFSQLKEKVRLQEEVDRIRLAYKSAEETREDLRAKLSMLENDTNSDRSEIDELRRLLRTTEERLHSLQYSVSQYRREKQEIETRVIAAKEQRDQDMRSLEQLRGWLTQAQDKLANAHQSLESTRKNKLEQENYLQSEINKRSSLEQEESELKRRMEAEVERDRREREARERELMAIDEERSRYEKTCRDTQAEIEEIIRKREMIQSRISRNLQQKNKLQDDNNRLNQMLQEAEEARSNIDSARAEKENKNKNIQAEIMEVEEQIKKREKIIDDLKQKLENERERMENALRFEQESRAEENARYRKSENELQKRLNSTKDEYRRTKEDLDTKQSKFEENAMRMGQENKSLEAALQAEESLAEALRERIAVLRDHLYKIEEEKNKVHVDLSGAQNRLKDAEAEKARALERERQMSEELERETAKEPEKIEAMEVLKMQLEDARIDKEKQPYEAKVQARMLSLENGDLQHVLERAYEDGRKIVDKERMRMQSDNDFKRSHEELHKQWEMLHKSQEELARALQNCSVPFRDFEDYSREAFIFPDTAPKTSRPLEVPPSNNTPVKMAYSSLQSSSNNGYVTSSPSMATYYNSTPVTSTIRHLVQESSFSNDNGSFI